jgi:hypothetical protein
MTTVMSDRLSGTVGNSFAGDNAYSNFSGTAPTYVADARYGTGLRTVAAVAGIVSETFSGTGTLRTFDRVYLLSAIPVASCAIMDVRDGSGVAICKVVIVVTTGKLQLQNSAGTTLTGGASAAGVPIATRFRIAYTMNGTAWTAVIYSNDTDNTIQQTLTPSGLIVSTTAASCREGFITTGGMGAGVTLSTYWPQDTDVTSDAGVRSLWVPGDNPQTIRRRTFSMYTRPPRTAPVATYAQAAPPSAVEPDPKRLPQLNRRRTAAPVPPQVAVAPPYVPAQVQPIELRGGALVRRGKTVTPVPAQQNPPKVPAQVQPKKLRGTGLRRGHGAQVVPPQLNPPLVPVAVRARNPRAIAAARRARNATPAPEQQPIVAVIRARIARAIRRPGHVVNVVAAQQTVAPATIPAVLSQRRIKAGRSRGRTATPVPAQLNPPKLPSVWTLRGKAPGQRRGKTAAPVPPQQAIVLGAVPTQGTLNRARTLALGRRGKTAQPVPVQDAPSVGPRRARTASPTRRGRTLTPVQPQQNPPLTPAQVQPHRARAIVGRLRGRTATPVPPQLNPPFAPAQVAPKRLRAATARLRGRAVLPVQPQVPPVIVPTAVRATRPRGIVGRRGRTIGPVPSQERAAAGGQVRRSRGWPSRRGAVRVLPPQPPAIPPKYPTRPPRPLRYIAARTRSRVRNWIQTLGPPGTATYRTWPARTKWSVSQPQPRWRAGLPALRWKTGAPQPRWAAGLPTQRWKVTMFTWRQPSTATLQCPVPTTQLVNGVPGNPTVFPVAFAWMAAPDTKPQVSDWQNGTWQTNVTVGPATPYIALTPLVGPDNGGLALSGIGTYYLWERVTTAGEVWEEEVGVFIIW